MFNSTQEFIDALGPKPDKSYFDLVHLKDCKAGFSIKRHYPEDCSYKPAKTKSGKPDNVAVIWVIYSPSNEAKDDSSRKTLVRVRIANLSLYVSNHWDYNFEDENCPTEDSLRASKVTKKPIDLEFNDEFFYDDSANRLIDSENNSIAISDLLNRVFNEHCDTVHLWRGLKIRAKLAARAKFLGFTVLLVDVLMWILKHVLGRTLEEKYFLSYLHVFEPSELKRLSTDTINIFGYSAAKNVIVLYCAMVILFSYHFYKPGAQEDGYLSYVSKNQFLMVAISILIIWLLEVALPFFLLRAINLIIKARIYWSLKKFTV